MKFQQIISELQDEIEKLKQVIILKDEQCDEWKHQCLLIEAQLSGEGDQSGYLKEMEQLRVDKITLELQIQEMKKIKILYQSSE